jgi:hypothetical protein
MVALTAFINDAHAPNSLGHHADSECGYHGETGA